MGNEWIKPILGKGFAVLLTLRLKNAPTEDMVKPTLETWFKVITHKKHWEQALDQPRFEEAFMYLAQTCEWFPAPKQLLEAMPPREILELPEPVISEAQRQKNIVRIKAMIAQLKGNICKQN